MKHRSQRGIALLLALILIAVVSVMATSIVFLSQSETWSSHNYRLMSQARDAAESGVHKAAHFLTHNLPTVTDNTYYNQPNAAAIAASYVITQFPVHNASGDEIGLDSTPNSDPPMTLAYPDATEQTQFQNYVSGTLNADNLVLNYDAYAELLAMRSVTQFGGSQRTVQTWRITSVGTVDSVQDAEVQVSAILDTPVTPTFNYAVFAEGNQCDQLTLTGGADVSSYSSGGAGCSSATIGTTYGAGSCGLQSSGGNVGTNGSLTTAGSTTNIYGTLSTPQSGVGNCTNGTITAWDPANGTLAGGLVGLPGEIDYPDPDAPTPTPATGSVNLNNNASCTGMAGCSVIVASTVYQLSPTCSPAVVQCGAGTTYRDLNVAAGKTVIFNAGTYNFNSIRLGANSNIIINGAVIFNIAGAGLTSGQYAADFSSGTITNSDLVASDFQVMYAGTAGIRATGGSTTAGLIYAPNASVDISGNSPWYGAVIGETVTINGNGGVSYDRQLQTLFFSVGNPVLQSFTWSKF